MSVNYEETIRKHHKRKCIYCLRRIGLFITANVLITLAVIRLNSCVRDLEVDKYTLVQETIIIHNDINTQTPLQSSTPAKNIITFNEPKVSYISLDVPVNGTSFKTYMDYRTITDTTSKQWNLQQLATTNEKGLRVFNNHYLVAVGTFYAQEVGKELRITLENGQVIDVIVGDIKMDIHTDINNQYVEQNGNIVEFIVDTDKLDNMTKILGDISNLGLKGKIIKIQEVIRNE